jgi:RNA polymerase sigma-70 factor (ECF subfamily)
MPPFGADQAMVEALRRGEEEAFRSLLERHGPAMLRTARHLLRNHALSEEVVQETWAALLAGLHRFQGRATLKTWLFRVLVKRCLTKRDREGRTVPFSALEASAQEDGPAFDPAAFNDQGHWRSPPRGWEDHTPERSVLNRELHEVVNFAIARLPAGQRSVITLRDIEGWTSEETCRVLSISEVNQRVLLHRARTKVREVLDSYLGTGASPAASRDQVRAQRSW